MATQTYRIEGTTPQVYLDNGGRPVSGYQVRGTLIKWDEAFELNVPSLDPSLIDQRVKQILANREKLDQLGSA